MVTRSSNITFVMVSAVMAQSVVTIICCTISVFRTLLLAARVYTQVVLVIAFKSQAENYTFAVFNTFHEAAGALIVITNLTFRE
jgi:hypothetical protein